MNAADSGELALGGLHGLRPSRESMCVVKDATIGDEIRLGSEYVELVIHEVDKHNY